MSSGNIIRSFNFSYVLLFDIFSPITSVTRNGPDPAENGNRMALNRQRERERLTGSRGGGGGGKNRPRSSNFGGLEKSRSDRRVC